MPITDYYFTAAALTRPSQIATFIGIGNGQHRGRAGPDQEPRSKKDLVVMCENGLFDQLPIGAAMLDKDGRFRRINAALCETVGYADHELLAMRLTDLVPPNDRNDIAGLIRQLADKSLAKSCRDVPYIDRHGNVGWMNVSIRSARVEEVPGACLLAVVENITQKKKDQAELVREKDECERVFHAVPDPIAILDVEHRIVRVNQAMAQRLGCNTQEVVGQRCFEVVHGIDEPRKNCPHVGLLTDGIARHCEMHEDRLGGDFLISVSPLHDANGQIAGSIHVARDITKRKQAEIALHNAYDTLEKCVENRTRELDDVNRALRQEIVERRRLEAEVLHAGTREQRRMGEELHDELGQELTGLRYLASSLARRLNAMDLPEADMASELASGIGQALQRTREIVRGLLPVEIDAQNLVPALESLAAEIEERFEITCHFFKHGHLPTIDDHTAIQLYRIAQGASNNAIKHGQPDSINIEIYPENDQMILRVSDDGIGIPDDMERGSGSGLQIMQYRAGAVGGTFDVRQGDDGGTVATCVIDKEGFDGCHKQTEIKHA